MKTLKLSICSLLLILFTQAGFAQTKSESFKVSGECGMCKKKIETAAKKAGAEYALWNVESKELTVKYNNAASNTAKIQQGIAAAGYDTPQYKASDEAYNSLHECCKYERTAAATSHQACGMDCCKQKEEGQSCCTDGKCTKDMDCCKDGKCSREAHEGHAAKGAGACCKKA